MIFKEKGNFFVLNSCKLRVGFIKCSKKLSEIGCESCWKVILMATVFDVAKYILEKHGKMSTWKLQKLCYYSQAWHYTWTEKPLFKEDFQAWRNGPVCRELYDAHKGKFMVEACDIQGDSSLLTLDEKDSIDIVLEDYGNRTPYDLREQSHSEAPWLKARGDLPSDANSENVISLESMGEYYGDLIYGQTNS